MKGWKTAVPAALAYCMGLGASSDPLAAAASAAWPDPPRPVMDSTGRVRMVVQNANNCAPFEADPVWGPGPPTAKPLGYRCCHNPNAPR